MRSSSFQEASSFLKGLVELTVELPTVFAEEPLLLLFIEIRCYSLPCFLEGYLTWSDPFFQKEHDSTSVGWMGISIVTLLIELEGATQECLRDGGFGGAVYF